MTDDPKASPETADEERVETVLSRLQAAVRQRQGEVAALTDGGRLPAGSTVDLLTRARLEEPISVSSIPLFGGLLVIARKLVFHLFLKWYVRPVLHQQNGYNQLLGQRLSEQEERLGRRLAALEERLARLEGERRAADG